MTEFSFFAIPLTYSCMNLDKMFIIKAVCFDHFVKIIKNTGWKL